MKKLALMAFAAIAMVSCSDDDSNGTNTTINAGVNGTWNLTSVTSATTLDANHDGVSSTNFKAETGCFNNSNIIFGEGNTAQLNLEIPFFSSCIPTTATSVYAVNGNNVTFTVTDEEGTSTETFTLSGNTLSIQTDFEVEIQVNNSVQTTIVPITMVYTKQ